MNNSTIRLDKYLANRGIDARRAIENLLQEKIVSINGKRVFTPGVRINPDKDKIVINGVELKKPELLYFLLNKPKGYISTTSDEKNRKNVVSLIKTDARIYPVGRLDKETTGLLILTNDGEFTNLLTHPKYHVNKTYRLTIQGKVSEENLSKLKKGIELEDGITFPAEVEVAEATVDETILELTIHEGRNRQIRRMCSALGIELKHLERVAIGGIKDNNLKKGAFRRLNDQEVEDLKKAAKANL